MRDGRRDGRMESYEAETRKGTKLLNKSLPLWPGIALPFGIAN